MQWLFISIQLFTVGKNTAFSGILSILPFITIVAVSNLSSQLSGSCGCELSEVPISSFLAGVLSRRLTSARSQEVVL